LGAEFLEHKLSVTSHTTLASGNHFFTFEDIKQERALYQQFTNKSLISRGYKLPLFSPEKAGIILANSIENFDFSMYEYFQTDRAGHSQDMKLASKELINLEQFISSFLETIDFSNKMVILTSDHGNIENLAVKTHTKNPAMTLLWGTDSKKLANQLYSIQDITKHILQLLDIE